MKWEPRRAMKNQPMNTLESRILTLNGEECQCLELLFIYKIKSFNIFMNINILE